MKSPFHKIAKAKNRPLLNYIFVHASKFNTNRPGKIAPARRLCYTNTYVGKIMFRRAVLHRVVPCAQTAGKRDTDENRI